MTLKDLKVGESAVVTEVGGQGALRQHFLDMGLIPGAGVKLVKMAPMGDPMEIKVHGYALTLRLSEALKIGVDKDLAQEKAPAGLLDEDFGYNASLQIDGKFNGRCPVRTHPGRTTVEPDGEGVCEA